MNDIPWLVPAAIEWIDAYLKPTMRAFEWGAGGSTLWYARRVKELVSIEHDSDWYGQVRDELAVLNIRNVILRWMPDGDFECYATVVILFDEPFDYIAVDGRARIKCIERAIPKLKSGGVLMLDNSERPEYATGTELMKDWKRIDFVD